MRSLRRRSLLPSLSTCALLAASACAPGADTGSDTPAEGPLYLVHTAVEGDEGRTNYFTLVDDLTSERTLDYGSSIEVPGRARLYAAPGVGFFAIGDSEAVTITRYELEEDGSLVAGDTLSLQNHAVTSMGAQAVLFVSETKAYYKDSGQAQLIVWNPSEMAVERTIELPDDLLEEGYVASLGDWVSRDGEAFFTVGWSSTTYDRVLPGSALVRIDTTNDELTVTRDDRCRGLDTAVNLDDTLYFFSGVINGFGHSVYPDDGGQQDCILRISAGASTFDDDYLGSIAPALDGRIGTVAAVTEDGQAWATVIDPEVAPKEPGTTYSEWYAQGWSWWHLSLETLDGAKQVAGEPGAFSSQTVTAGDSLLISAAEADYSSSTLMDLSSGSPKPGVTFPGFLLDAARVR